MSKKHEYERIPWESVENNRYVDDGPVQKICELAIDTFGNRTPEAKEFINTSLNKAGNLGAFE